MKLLLLAISFGFFSENVLSQELFLSEILDNPKKYGEPIENSLPKNEVPELLNSLEEGTFFLKNGLRSSKYLNADEWIRIKDSVTVSNIYVAFSKYPIKRGKYSMKHDLLFNRLKNLFIIDSELNSIDINYEIILQTNCISDGQVDSLFHGIIIEYESIDEKELETEKKAKSATDLAYHGNSMSASELKNAIEMFESLPKDLKSSLDSLESDSQLVILEEYFEEKLLESGERRENSFSEKRKKVLEGKVNSFLRIYGGLRDSTTYKVLERNQDWENSLVVSDWTGSIYGYGAQALQWHVNHLETSGLSYFTLFNDGDNTSTGRKMIGATEGIYHAQANQIDKLIQLYQLVMLKGGGGDGPENDLEAVLAGMEEFPEYGEIILIADNNACVRDIELLEYIDKPVRVVLCGYKSIWGVNPQYIEIAEQTGGSIHTMEEDLTEFNYEVVKKRTGKKRIVGSELKIGKKPCSDKAISVVRDYGHVYMDLDSAKQDKWIVNKVSLSGKGLSKVPGKIKKLKVINSLDLSNNNLQKLNNNLLKCITLRELNLSNNQISELPVKMGKLHLLKHLDLSSNKFDTLSYRAINQLKFLKTLNLSDNSLSELPKSFSSKYLEVFDLSQNELTELPAKLTSCRRLKKLYLNDNQLNSLPRRFSKLKHIEELDISFNELTDLPSSLFKLKKLRLLNISGNEFSDEYIKEIKAKLPETIIEVEN